MVTADKPTFVLESRPPVDVPWDKSDQLAWFSRVPSGFGVHTDYIEALLAMAVADQQCPMSSELMSWTVCGAIIAWRTGSYPILPDPGLYPDFSPQTLLWEALWQAFEQHPPTTTELVFTAAMLTYFLPVWHHVPPDRPFRQSRFENQWVASGYGGDLFRQVDYLSLRLVKRGQATFKRLPAPVQQCILAVAAYTPHMLELVNGRASHR